MGRSSRPSSSSTIVSPQSAKISERIHSSVLYGTSAIAEPSVSARAPRSSFHVATEVLDHVVELRPVGEIDIATVAAFRAALWAAPARPALPHAPARASR